MLALFLYSNAIIHTARVACARLLLWEEKGTATPLACLALFFVASPLPNFQASYPRPQSSLLFLVHFPQLQKPQKRVRSWLAS